jgi:hypothetical protein
MVPTKDGPVDKRTQRKVNPSHLFDELGIDHSVDITNAYSLLSRSDRNFIGTVHKMKTTVLIDTGATDFSYVARSLVQALRLPVYKMLSQIRVRSVHDTSIVSEYCIVPVTITYGNYLRIYMVLPCLILESSPRDIIVGMPAITEYDLLTRLGRYFKDIGKELHQRQAELFPHLPLHRKMAGSGPGAPPPARQTEVNLMSTVLSTIQGYPYPRAPILPPTSEGQTVMSSDDLPAHPSYETTDRPDEEASENLMSAGIRPPHTYTVLHRDQLLDTAVEPDHDSIPLGPDPPDPVATAMNPPKEKAAHSFSEPLAW